MAHLIRCEILFLTTAIFRSVKLPEGIMGFIPWSYSFKIPLNKFLSMGNQPSIMGSNQVFFWNSRTTQRDMFTICIQPTLVHNRLWIWATRNWELTKHDRDIMWIYKQHYCMTNMISKGVSRNRLHSAKITSVNEKNDDHLIIIGNLILNNDFHSQFKNLMISWNIAFKKKSEKATFSGWISRSGILFSIPYGMGLVSRTSSLLDTPPVVKNPSLREGMGIWPKNPKFIQWGIEHSIWWHQGRWSTDLALCISMLVNPAMWNQWWCVSLRPETSKS